MSPRSFRIYVKVVTTHEILQNFHQSGILGMAKINL